MTNYLKTDAYVDVLVWRAETLSLESYFGYYVECLGMSPTEAVDVTIVRQHRMTLDAASRANSQVLLASSQEYRREIHR